MNKPHPLGLEYTFNIIDYIMTNGAFKDYFEKLGGVELLEKLQLHTDEVTIERISSLIKKFWTSSGDIDMQIE